MLRIVVTQSKLGSLGVAVDSPLSTILLGLIGFETEASGQ